MTICMLLFMIGVVVGVNLMFMLMFLKRPSQK